MDRPSRLASVNANPISHAMTESQLRLERSSLRIQLSNLESLPRDVSDLAAGGLDKQNEKLAQQLSSLEEKTILFRSAGWTCFEIVRIRPSWGGCGRCGFETRPADRLSL